MDLKEKEVQKQSNLAEPGPGIEGSLGYSKTANLVNASSSPSEQFSGIDIEHGEWKIVTRRRRYNSSKIENKTQMATSKSVPATAIATATKKVWREVSKVQYKAEIQILDKNAAAEHKMGNIGLVNKPSNEMQVDCKVNYVEMVQSDALKVNVDRLDNMLNRDVLGGSHGSPSELSQPVASELMHSSI